MRDCEFLSLCRAALLGQTQQTHRVFILLWDRTWIHLMLSTTTPGSTSINKTLSNLPKCKKLPDQELFTHYPPFLQPSSWKNWVLLGNAGNFWCFSVVQKEAGAGQGDVGAWRELLEPVGSHYSNRGGGQPSAARQQQGKKGEKNTKPPHSEETTQKKKNPPNCLFRNENCM